MLQEVADSTGRKKFYFTFGCGDPVNAGKYAIVIATNTDVARAKMCALFGDKWAFVYPSAKAAGVREWRLQLVGTWTADVEEFSRVRVRCFACGQSYEQIEVPGAIWPPKCCGACGERKRFNLEEVE